MQQINPGIAKGYALDFAAPLRYVAEALDARKQTLDELLDGYHHDPADLDRVWDHELRQRGQRRNAKPALQEQRRSEAKRWLLRAAIDVLADQVREQGGRLALTVALQDVNVAGLPVAFDPARVTREAAKRRRNPPGPSPAAPRRQNDRDEPARRKLEASPRNLFREWAQSHGYTDRAIARALGLERDEVEAYLEGEKSAPRVVLLALWAIEHGAEISGRSER